MKMHELLASPEKWTKGAYAMDASGLHVPERHPDARRWCLLGAANYCYGLASVAVEMRIRDALLAGSGDKATGIASWNDAPDRTFDDVRKLLLDLDI